MKDQENLVKRRRRCGRALSGPIITICLVMSLTIVLPACSTTSLPEPPTERKPGQLSEGQDVFGTFYAYVPMAVPEKPETLVLVHGTPPKDGTAEENVAFYATTWIDFAEEHGYLVLGPVFNQEDFSSRLGD
jgi:poly(3-hydroxybutyrate) depolymerase